MNKSLKNFIKHQINIGKSCYNPTQSENDIFAGFSTPLTLETSNAILVEESKAGLTLKSVQIKAENSGFGFFLDGIERKRTLKMVGHLPIIYGYVAAVILQRTNKKLHSCGLEKPIENIYMPVAENGDEPDFYFKKNELDLFNLKAVNIGKKADNAYPLYPQEFEKLSHNEIQEQRRKAETQISENWLKNFKTDEWLCVDGGLNRSTKSSLDSQRIAGIIKSHNTVYFPPEEQFKIYSMIAGERSSIFIPVARNKKEKNVYSWYLRIHNRKSAGDPNFGIVRVEIPQNKDLTENELIQTVNEISSWILLEKKPVAFPASRWDRMIYPIKYCEDYLKSKAPSLKYIDNLI